MTEHKPHSSCPACRGKSEPLGDPRIGIKEMRVEIAFTDGTSRWIRYDRDGISYLLDSGYTDRAVVEDVNLVLSFYSDRLLDFVLGHQAVEDDGGVEST